MYIIIVFSWRDIRARDTDPPNVVGPWGLQSKNFQHVLQSPPEHQCPRPAPHERKTPVHEWAGANEDAIPSAFWSSHQPTYVAFTWSDLVRRYFALHGIICKVSSMNSAYLYCVVAVDKVSCFSFYLAIRQRVGNAFSRWWLSFSKLHVGSSDGKWTFHNSVASGNVKLEDMLIVSVWIGFDPMVFFAKCLQGGYGAFIRSLCYDLLY